MAINTGYIINGTIGNICGYMSRGGRNIIRKKSSLTAARVKKDQAFRGFRESGNRMKKASPIASFLYGLLPKEKREYSLYRRLTGEALNLLKEGMDTELITETLHALYIQPVLAFKEDIRNQQIAQQPISKHHISTSCIKNRPKLSYKSVATIPSSPSVYSMFWKIFPGVRAGPYPRYIKRGPGKHAQHDETLQYEVFLLVAPAA